MCGSGGRGGGVRGGAWRGEQGLPYSAGHAIQLGILPCTGKPEVADLDEGGRLAVKQGVIQLHVSAVGFLMFEELPGGWYEHEVLQ